MMSDMKDSLYRILSRIKRGAPLYSPRQIAHIVSDPTIPALVGYFAGMLYNQNNVVEEVSPDTLKMERRYMAALARMTGLPEFIPTRLNPDSPQMYSWGHLASGGTAANLEALWAIRNLKFYLISIKLLAKIDTDFADIGQIEISLPSGVRSKISDSTAFQLLNTTSSEVFRIRERIRGYLNEKPELMAKYRQEMPNVKTLGFAGLMEKYNSEFPDDQCLMPRVLISRAQHYCWKKNMDIIGIGSNSLIEIPTDRHIRIDIEKLKDKILELKNENRATLAVVSICGTTEEGSVDPLHRITELRRELELHDISFWHHSDAALGGFFSSMIPRTNEGGFVQYDDLPDKDRCISKEAYNGICALSQADSMAIDPHKFGYVPYPCGAVLFRNYLSRNFISYEAPYLATKSDVGFGGFLGQWTLEGSRPGAMAISCYFSQSVLPLDHKGHGQLIRNCIEARKKLVDNMCDMFDASNIKMISFTEPDTAGYCFVLAPPDGINTIEDLNKYNLSIWKELTIDENKNTYEYDYLISKTEVDCADYYDILTDKLERTGIKLFDEDRDARIVLLRIFVMNPFIIYWDELPERFAGRLSQLAHRALPGE
jgi:glutamate/tyrosine decarboxylase-like PLP-dependent enzyme